MTAVHYVDLLSGSPTAGCCDATLSDLHYSEITMHRDKVTCSGPRALRPAPAVEIPTEGGGGVVMIPIATADQASLGVYTPGRTISAYARLTRETGGQLRDALTSWLEPTNADDCYTRPDGIEDVSWMRPHRELIDGLPGLTPDDRVRLHRMADAVYVQAEAEAHGSDAELREIYRLLGAGVHAVAPQSPAPAVSAPVPQADAGVAEQPAAPASRGEREPVDLLTALQRSIDKARGLPSATGQAPKQRYDQCDAACTVDCGHCKGEGPPASRGGAVTQIGTGPASVTCGQTCDDLEAGLKHVGMCAACTLAMGWA